MKENGKIQEGKADFENKLRGRKYSTVTVMYVQ